MVLFFSSMEFVVGALALSLAILVFIIAYRKLLAYLGKGRLPKEKYCVLHSLEIDPAHGEVKFYFTSEEKKEVKIHLLDEQYNFVQEIYNTVCKADGNVIPFNTKQLKNGIYYYCLMTDNQKTLKKMQLHN